MKLIFKNKEVQYDGSFNLCLDVYMETRDSFVCLFGNHLVLLLTLGKFISHAPLIFRNRFFIYIYIERERERKRVNNN
jgi:hypothetical protein